ncbi:MAG TPA: hypothetical protein VKG91_13400 [Roseiarcus sp.]|nr:hypothetical protein [Roseiarcus sp.]
MTFGAIMLDRPEKTLELLATLEAAAPFEVELTSDALALLRSQENVGLIEPRQVVSKVYYAGDEGGIICGLLRNETEDGVYLSLTHMRLHRKHPFADAVIAYQNHRVKKLKKLHGR